LPLRNTLAALCLLTLCFGCEDLRDFKTGPQQVFRGEVVGSDSAESANSFIRRGFASHTMLELRFNPNASGVPTTEDAGPEHRRRAVPGMLHSYVCPAGKTACDESERTPGPFDHARLLAIDGLAHDTLSQYTFPGGGRLHNYIFSVRFFAETEAGQVARDAMIFVSLMQTRQIEVRAIAPSVLSDDGMSERLPALFGLFVLERDRL
jgi:hypothetical protein